MAMRIWNKTVYSSAHLTRPLLKPHREIFAWCVKSVIVNKMLVFCCCFIYIYMYMYLCVYIYYIALAHPVSFAALSPLPDPLVKKQHKNRLVFAYITQFSQLQSDANCPDESILKQSKKNWARLWSTIKRPLNICISEHAPANDSLPPPPHPNPIQPPLHFHLSAEASQHWEGEEDQWPAAASSNQGIELFAAIYTTLWYTTKTGSLQVCKHAFRFICSEPVPGCLLWALTVSYRRANDSFPWL